MKKTKIKQKGLKIMTIILLLFVLFEISKYFLYTFTPNLATGNTYAFWGYVFLGFDAATFRIISPIVFLFGAISSIFYLWNSSFLKDILLRMHYKAFLIKTLFFTYLKTWLPFALISVTVLLLGYILYTHEIVFTTDWSEITNFYYEGVKSPLIYILLHHVLWFLFIATIVNVGMVVMYITKKFSLTIILSYLFLFLFNFAFQFVCNYLIVPFIGNPLIQEWLMNFSFFDGFLSQENIWISLIDTMFFFLLSCIPIYVVYCKKEKVVRNYE